MRNIQDTVLINMLDIQPRNILKVSKTLGQAQFIEKVLKESKSTYNRGLSDELVASMEIHAKGIPVIINPLVLRKLNLGQIDLCHIANDHLVVYEIKSYPVLSNRQKYRLIKSTHYLAEIFNKYPLIRLRVISK